MKHRDQSNPDRHSSGWIEAVDEEKRSANGDRIRTIRGYAILWDTPSERMGRVVETIDSRALDHLGDLNDLDVQMLYGHDANLVMARTTNGSLRLTKDERGVLAEADVHLDDPDGVRLVRKIERGLITQQSFGFRIAAGGEDLTELDDGTIRAHVTRIETLYEVSPVGRPAYRDTSIEAVAPCSDCSESPCACSHDSDEDAVEEDRSWTLYHARRNRPIDLEV